MVFSLCSSAGVQGVLVRLFLAGGGPIGEDVMLESSAPMDEDATPDGSVSRGAGCAAPDVPDIDADGVSELDRRLLLRVVGDGVCVVVEVSAALGIRYASGTSEAGSSSCLSTRLLDIDDKVQDDAQVLKIFCCT